MRPLQARLVTFCQQVLALGVVLVVLTPASGVVSLDIVGEAPGAPTAAPAAPAALMSATVPTKAVTPNVTEVPLTGAAGGFAGLRGRTVAGGATEARVVSTPQPVDALRRGRRDVAERRGARGGPDHPPRPHPQRRRVERLGGPGVPRRARTRPGQRRGRGRPPRHRAHVRRRRRRRAGRGPHRRRRPAGRPLPRPGRPGVGREDRDRGAGRHRRRGPERVVRRRLRAGGRHRRRVRGHHPAGRPQADRRAAHDLLARPVGRRREHPQQERAALRLDQRRLRPPHGQRQRLHRGPGARAPAQHLRLPREVEGLERHRLQLPRRPLRSDLGGPLRRHRHVPSSAPTRSTTTTTRSRCRPSATSTPSSRPT